MLETMGVSMGQDGLGKGNLTGGRNRENLEPMGAPLPRAGQQ
jgi:hypothetical protein